MNKKFSLTADELAEFRKNGFIGPFDLYEPEEMKARYRQIRADLFDRQHAVYDINHQSVLATYDRHLDVDGLSELIMRAEIVNRVEKILGPDIICWRTELFSKYPGDEGTDWHQADNFGHASGAPQIVWPMNDRFGGAVTVWTAFTEANEDNGCLRFIPGTHEEMFYDKSKPMEYHPEKTNHTEINGMKRGFFGYDYRNLQKDPNWRPEEHKAVSIVMKPGQFVIFWSTLMHSSFPNSTSNNTRMGYAARYVPSAVDIYPGIKSLTEYGDNISLDKYGAVRVCGGEQFSHNKVLTENTKGYPFKVMD